MVVVAGGVVAALFASGVFSDQGATVQPDATTSPFVVPTPPGPIVVRIDPAQPAVVVGSGGDVTVSLDAGTVQEHADLSYSLLREIPTLPVGFQASDKRFDISLTAAAGPNAGPVVLMQPITVRVSLD